MSKASQPAAQRSCNRLYGFNGWTTGPEAIAGLLYGPALFNVRDGQCAG